MQVYPRLDREAEREVSKRANRKRKRGRASPLRRPEVLAAPRHPLKGDGPPGASGAIRDVGGGESVETGQKKFDSGGRKKLYIYKINSPLVLTGNGTPPNLITLLVVGVDKRSSADIDGR